MLVELDNLKAALRWMMTRFEDKPTEAIKGVAVCMQAVARLARALSGFAHCRSAREAPMTLPFKDPLRRCLKVEEWPAPDQAAWDTIFQPGDLLDGTVGEGHHWCPDTRRLYRKSYGRWLTFLVTSDRLEPIAEPASRITKEGIEAYMKELETHVASLDPVQAHRRLQGSLRPSRRELRSPKIRRTDDEKD